MNRFQMFPTFSRFRVFQVMCITDAIISFSLCVYLIFLRDFSAVVHSGNGGDALLYKSIQPASRYLCHFRGFLWVNPFMYDMHARFAMRKLCECSIRVAPLRIMFRKSVQTALEVVNRDNRIITIVCLYCVKLRLNQLWAHKKTESSMFIFQRRQRCSNATISNVSRGILKLFISIERLYLLR